MGPNDYPKEMKEATLASEIERLTTLVEKIHEALIEPNPRPEEKTNVTDRLVFLRNIVSDNIEKLEEILGELSQLR